MGVNLVKDPLYQCPGGKKISSGDPGQIPAGTGNSRVLSRDFSGKQQKFSGNSSRSDRKPGMDPNSVGIPAGRAGKPVKTDGVTAINQGSAGNSAKNY